MMKASVVLLVFVAACGSALPESRPERGEGEALDARAWHAEVVRIEGAISVHPEEVDPSCCVSADRACSLSARICAVSRSDEMDEGTRVLCEDAEPRCAVTRGRATAVCGCEGQRH